MVMGTSFWAAWQHSGENTSAAKRPATSCPKMLLMAATEGSGTLKMQNWRLRRLGMSFLPPPGVFIAARYWQSMIIFMSPMGFSREYIPPCSNSCLTTSLVTWSPQSFICGMEMSSTNTSSFLPPGGPKVRPWRFSTLASTVNWKMLGVVREENVMDLDAMTSGSNEFMNDLIVVVLAVPGPPTKREDLPTEATSLRMHSRRTESSVGITSWLNLGFSSATGYSQSGTLSIHVFHSVLSSLTKYSKNVSVSGFSQFGVLPLLSSTSLWLNLTRSGRWSIAPTDQHTQ
mmetsp:Transcript_29254/g.72342  ORF Transcript_29254/g.72342 Transcript_29254/m.72342 type:complete len:287 (+) Transcript_29254:1995-2855(+)